MSPFLSREVDVHLARSSTATGFGNSGGTDQDQVSIGRILYDGSIIGNRFRLDAFDIELDAFLGRQGTVIGQQDVALELGLVGTALVGLALQDAFRLGRIDIRILEQAEQEVPLQDAGGGFIDAVFGHPAFLDQFDDVFRMSLAANLVDTGIVDHRIVVLEAGLALETRVERAAAGYAPVGADGALETEFAAQHFRAHNVGVIDI